jgi:transcriptional regulator with XRE-family HTH domain
MEQLETITMVRRELNRRNISGAELARALKVNPSSVMGMFNRSTLQVQRLAEISEFLRYNFFRELAQKLPFTEPDYSEVTSLQNRVKELEFEVNILRQTIRDLAGR